MKLSRAHTSTEAQQPPHETTFKFTIDPDFYLDLHRISHAHKYQFPKQEPWIILYPET